MTKELALRLLASATLTTLLSCDAAPAPTPPSDLALNDCPLGMFRPLGGADCVFPADDAFGQPLGFSDNRCAEGQPAVPPQCVSESGGRAYLSRSTCVKGYRFLAGACNRNSTGVDGGPVLLDGGGFDFAPDFVEAGPIIDRADGGDAGLPEADAGLEAGPS